MDGVLGPRPRLRGGRLCAGAEFLQPPVRGLRNSGYNFGFDAGIAQLVERNLAKVEVASSSLVSRSRSVKGTPLRRPFASDVLVAWGALAKRLCSGLQIRLARFDSGTRLHESRCGSSSVGRA